MGSPWKELLFFLQIHKMPQGCTLPSRGETRRLLCMMEPNQWEGIIRRCGLCGVGFVTDQLGDLENQVILFLDCGFFLWLKYELCEL